MVYEIEGLSARINDILKFLDADIYKAHEKLREKLLASPADCVLTMSNILLWVGRSFILNRATPLHRDGRDHPANWTLLITLGTSTSGDLWLLGIATRMFYEPGTIVFIRGGLMEHQVLDFKGQRIAIAHFVHKSV